MSNKMTLQKLIWPIKFDSFEKCKTKRRFRSDSATFCRNIAAFYLLAYKADDLDVILMHTTEPVTFCQTEGCYFTRRTTPVCMH